MTALAPHTPDEREYDAAADAYESWLLAISELRRQHLARDTEEGREDVGCLRGVQQAARSRKEFER